MSYTSRSGGGSACSHAAYISGSIVKDERTGMAWDYSKKAHDVLCSEILAPENSPEWVYDTNSLWNEVERFEDYIAEKRFKGHKDPIKNAKSLRGKEKFLLSCKTSFKANFALPLEITDKEHLQELARKIVKECYVDHGLVAQYAIHDMKGNPHLHIIATTRPLVEGSFSEKRFVIDKIKLVEMRKQMAEICNQYAQEKGYDYHIDHRSYKDQGIKLVATKHLGPNARHRLQELSQNVQDNEEVRQKNIEILINHPEEIIKVVASQKAVFTQADLYKEIFKRVAGDEKLYSALKAKVDGLELPSIAMIGKTLNDNHIYESKSIGFEKKDYTRIIESFTAQLLSQEQAIYLGENIKGQAFYTSSEMKKLETSIAEKVEILTTRKVSSINEKYKLNSIEKIQKQERIQFSDEQLGAINHLLSNKSISVLTGKAGTGKSTVLKPVVETYKKSGLKVIGTAFQGKVADQLSHELIIEGYTLDQLNTRWSEQDKYKRLIENKELKGKALVKAKEEVKRLQKWRLTDKHVVILDEGSMVHGDLWEGLLFEVERSGARLRIVQDNNQIKALHGLDAARLIEERVGAYEINGVVRQREKWMKEASSLLNEHLIEEGLKPYYDNGYFNFRSRDYEAKVSLVADYLDGLARSPHKDHMALAQKNKDVIEINELIRGELFKRGQLGEQEFIFGQEGQGIVDVHQSVSGPKTHHFRKSAYGRRFAVGDRVMFLSNDHKGWHIKTLEKGRSDRKGVKNGTLGVIESFNLRRQTVEVRLTDGRLVGFDSKGYDALTHGYAMTINKSQGATFDHSYGLFSSFNANQLLIWLTRHRETFKGYVSKEMASDLKGLVSHVTRADYKGLSTDYDLDEHQKPSFNLVQHYWTTAQEAGNLLTKLETLKFHAEQAGKEVSFTKEWEQYTTLVQARNQKAQEILNNWPQCSSFLQQTGIRRETLEVQAGLKSRLLSVAEQAALEKVELYFKVAHDARILWKDISQTHPGSMSYEHPEYQDYAKVKEIRNELAYEMASLPMMYKPFFKVKEQEGAYITYHGTLYEQRPQSFKAVLAQAEQYIAQKRTEKYESHLTFHERVAYKQVQEYRSLHYMSVAAFKQLPEIQKMAATQLVIEGHQAKIKELAKNRDELAYQIIENYSTAQPFVEKLGLKEDLLLKHAVFGEVRQTIEAYRVASSVEERTHLASQLLSFAFKEEGGVDKALYGLLKEQGVDLQRLKFEHGWSQAQQSHPISLKELDSLYEDLSSYRHLHKEVAREWEIIKTSATQKVAEVQEEQIKSLNLLRATNKLERATLEEEAISVLKLKASNTQTLAYVNNHIRLAVNGVQQWSDLKEEIQGRQLELNQLHTSLQKGRSGYVEIYTREGQTSAWQSLRTQKLQKAKSLMKTYSHIHRFIPSAESDRLFKEAHEHQMLDLVKQFKEAIPQDKPALAKEIQGWLSLEQDERLTYTLASLKQEGIAVEAIHLYEKVLSLPQERQGEVIPLLQTYIEAKQEFSKTWQRYSEAADLKLAGEKITLQEQSLALEAKLHTKNAQYNPHYFVERTLQRASQTLKEAGLTTQQWNLLEQGNERDAGLLEKHQMMNEKVDVWLERGSHTYGWTLNAQEKLQLQKKIITLAFKHNDLFEKKLETISSLIKQENHQVPSYAIAAGKRNKAAFELINSGFISREDSDYTLNQVQNHALRYACSSSRLEKIHARDPAKFKEHKVVLFLKDQLAHGDEKLQARIANAFEEAGLNLNGQVLKVEERKVTLSSQRKAAFEDLSFTPKKTYSNKRSFNTPQYDKDVILKSLTNSQIESLYARHIDLWVTNPKPTYRSHEIRYGSKGGFVVYRDKRTWCDFKSGEGGDIFNYISKALNISYGQAIKQIGEEINAPQLTSINWEERAQRQSELKLQLDLEEKARIEKSRKQTQWMHKRSEPIPGTLAEKYLREHRHIKTAELPEDLRFIPHFEDPSTKKRYPALAAFTRDTHGHLSSLQITCLDPHTANKADIDVKKRSMGPISGRAVEIQKGEGATYIAEGVETALSLKEAGVKGRILVSLGLSNIRNVGSHLKDKTIPIVICGDADDQASSAWETSERNVEKLQEEGFKVSIIRPQGEKGRDFNDVLKEEGIRAVQEAFKEVALFQETHVFQETRPPKHVPRQSAEETAVSYELGRKAETIQKQGLQDLPQEIDKRTQAFLKAKPEITLESLNEWRANLDKKMREFYHQDAHSLSPQQSKENFTKEHPEINAHDSQKGKDTYEQRRQAYLEILKSSSTRGSEPKQALTIHDVVFEYKYLKNKLETLDHPQRLSEARQAMETLVLKAYKDPHLMQKLQITHKEIARDIQAQHEDFKQEHSYSRSL